MANADLFELYDKYGDGLPPNLLPMLAQIESNHDPRADNPWSSAGGLFQFTDATAPSYGLSGNKRYDPEEATRAAAELARDNAKTLRRALGREPTAPELYLAHQQGATGAAALLKNPNRPAVEVLTQVYGSREKAQRVIQQNGGRLNQTGGQFAGQWVSKAETVLSRMPPSNVPNTVATATDTVRRPQPTMPTPMPASIAQNRAFQNALSNAQPATADPAQVYRGIYPQPPAPQAPLPSMVMGRGITDSVEMGRAAQDPALAAALEARIAANQRPQAPAAPLPPPQSFAGPTRPPVARMSVAEARADNGQGRPLRPLPRQDVVGTSMERTATARNESLQQQLERRIAAYNGDDRGGGSGVTVATIPTTPARVQLPPVAASTSASPRMVQTSMQRAAAARDPQLAAALAAPRTQTAQRQPTASERAALSYVPPKAQAVASAPRQPSAAERAALAYVAPVNPRIGQPPATRVVPSVPASLASTQRAPTPAQPSRLDPIGGPLPSWDQFSAEFGTPGAARTAIARPAAPNPALGPNPGFVKSGANNERLLPGLPYPQDTAQRLGAGVSPPAVANAPRAITGFPTSASLRPGAITPLPAPGLPPPLPTLSPSTPSKPSVRGLPSIPVGEAPWDFGEAVGEWFGQTPLGRVGNAMQGKPQAEWDGWGVSGLAFGAPLAPGARTPLGWIQQQTNRNRLPQPPAPPARRNSTGGLFGMMFGGNPMASLSGGGRAANSQARAGFLPPAQRAATLQGINPSNHSQAQLDAVAAGRSYYTGSDGGMQPTHAMNGRLRNTY